MPYSGEFLVLTYNVHEAKTHFSKLLARVAAGEEVLIARAGEVVAKIVPVRSRRRRQPDGYRERIAVAEADIAARKCSGLRQKTRPLS